jgi:phosphoglycerate dehydrogenase-like enzyme
MNEAPVYRKALADAGLADRLDLRDLATEAPMPAELARDAEVLLGWRAPAGLLGTMPRLRVVQSVTAGCEHWLALPDLPAGVTLACARGSHRVQMPENILGALFNIAKPFVVCAADQKERRWVRRVSDVLAGRTLGILGLGAIGQELARKARALELRVIGTRRSGGTLPDVDRVYAPDATDDVLAQSDFVLLLLPHTPQTDGFMHARRLAAMRPTAWLLNFGRGTAVVDDDLVAAVKARTIAGAVLDVFRKEPLPSEHPFWTTNGITVLPHIGGLRPARDEQVAAVFVENMRRHLAGEPLREVVDRAKGY